MSLADISNYNVAGYKKSAIFCVYLKYRAVIYLVKVSDVSNNPESEPDDRRIRNND
jgi:hypothetical protein